MAPARTAGRSLARAAALAGLVLLGAARGALPARAQEAPPEGSAAASAEEPAKPKRKPRPKPVRKPPAPAAENAGPRGAAEGKAPEVRPGGRGEAAPFAGSPVREQTPTPEAPDTPARPPVAAGAVVACEPGQAVLYDGPAGFSFWVTRSGSVTIENPLRPLTPDVTRVLQLVIGDKLATAYGRDLAVLRRGATPGALEGLLGGPVRWDAALPTLPDGLDIVSDSGTAIAQMRFKECGTAPAAKAPPVAAGKAARPRRKEGRQESQQESRQEGAPDEKPRPGQRAPGTGQAAAPPGGTAPRRRFDLPQGAISE